LYRTCAIDNTSVLCSECFFASDHAGHDVTFGVAYSFSGYCDCGDPSSWSKPTNCPHHPPTDNLLEASSSNLVNPPIHLDLPTNRSNDIRATLELVLDYIIETFEAGPPEGNIAVPRTIEEVVFETQGAKSLRGKVRLERVSLILWGDEKHTAKEVVRQISIATGMGKADAKVMVNELDKNVSRVSIERRFYRFC
jgi:E3 ubiquitin-protein ligase UBR1